jgi:8-oxo-dGTP pyrophosphatase MutT (NUDIX family)
MTLYGAAAILYRKEQIILVKHNVKSDHLTGHYSLPGGRNQETDFSTIDTILREVHEETGLELDDDKLRLLGHYNFDLGGKVGIRKVEVYLYCYEIGDSQNLKNLGYETTPEWVKMKDYLEGKYPISFTSKNFDSAVRKFIKNLMV